MRNELHRVEKLRHPARPKVFASSVPRVAGANVKLVDDEIAELRRSPALVVPRVGRRAAEHTAGPRPVVRQLASARIALEALAAVAADEEPIGVALLGSLHEPAPSAIARLDQAVGIGRHPARRAVIRQSEVDAPSGRRPNPKGCAPAH